MICSYCATELPAGAMFCGECGRSVTAESPVVTVSAPTTRIPIPAASVDRCAQCGAVLEPTEIFCGECGFVRQLGAQPPRDTVLLDPFPWGRDPTRDEPIIHDPALHEQALHEPVIHEPVIREPIIHDPVIHDPVHDGPVAFAVAAVSHEPAPGDPIAADEELSEPDIGETRIVDRSRHGDRFVLQFSTGESVSVTGSGLLGRNPLPEPGEYFDSIVVISDPGRSVSKTHLEFGQDSGVFWISDRYSGNGTVVREPESQPRRCDAGKRYRVVRGTRVDIGEQFFIVS